MVVMSFFGVVCIILNKSHYLLVFLCVEFLVIYVFLLFFTYFYFLNCGFFFSSYFLSITVCGSVLGLSLLVFMIRTHGSDYINLASSLW
uniref:NADH-ubiquinone oxidoreductase chain 4L n=1 Tax=Scolytinae sp. BMNH 1040002 TaxID=1903775 RepID=A0A343A5V9_9CUCU|nr:NADH dehydrogenase subunit 4L [Scolytinae sp. BMNH 1040002]